MLDRFVPSDEELATRPGEERHPELLWGIVAAASFLSPILILLLRRRLFADEDVSPVTQPLEDDFPEEQQQLDGRSRVTRRGGVHTAQPTLFIHTSLSLSCFSVSYLHVTLPYPTLLVTPYLV